ncbi:MAG: NADH-quinone oxidoreductase subunit L, partial [Campylobacterales bacterium]|nr:NADH-quinone oxidoreductase subunit L [Campylobacterales bacterium]
EYESLKKIGSMMGSGGVIVIDDSSSMVEVAKYFMDFCVSESCGKCTPCRVGTTQMYKLLEKFAAKEATNRDLEQLVELCELVAKTSLCGLGQTAPNPVMSTLRYFKDEYLNSIKEEKND